MASILPKARTQFLNLLGRPLVGGKVYFYEPGTETKKDTWQDEAMTIPNTNPVVLDARGEATIWGAGEYRQIVKDLLGITIWDGIVSDVTQDIEDIATNLAAADGSSLVGFTQVGSGAVSTMVQDELRVRVRPEQFGAVGDGSDETAKIQAALNISSGKELVLGQNKTYGITAISIPSDVTIVSNGSKFVKVAAGEAYAITGGIRLTCDRLWLQMQADAYNTGINLNGGSMKIGEIRVESLNGESGQQTTASTIRWTNGLLIGPETGPNVGRDQIGMIYVGGFMRPVALRNMAHTTIGFIHISNFRTAVYINNCQNMVINGGDAYGRSPSSTGTPGENVILAEPAADFGLFMLTVNNFQGADSGEHTYRIGGDFSASDIYFNNCKAIRPGRSNYHGGCGFKAQGLTTKYHYNVHVTNLYVEDAGLYGENYNAITYAGVYGGTITNLIAKANQQQYSCTDGISLLSCTNVIVSNPQVDDCMKYGIRMYTAVGAGYPFGLTDVQVIGGRISNASGTNLPVVRIDGNDGPIDGPMKRISLKGTTLHAGKQAIDVQPLTTGGSLTNVSLDFIYTNSEGTGAVATGTDTFYITALVDAYDNAMPCMAGSVQRDRNGRTLTKNSLGWGFDPKSFTTTIADQSAISWVPANPYGVYALAPQGSQYYGLIWTRVGSSPAAAKIAGGTGIVATTGALTGTTGTNGNMTMSVDATRIYLENRSGGPMTITVGNLG